MEELTNLELTRDDMTELSAEELVDLKIKLEDLIVECEEVLKENEEEE